jgi:hypothetical protein
MLVKPVSDAAHHTVASLLRRTPSVSAAGPSSKSALHTADRRPQTAGRLRFISIIMVTGTVAVP